MSSFKAISNSIVKIGLLAVIIPTFCMLGGCTAAILYAVISQPARQATITKAAAPYTIRMGSYTLIVLTFETAAQNTWWELWRSDGTADGTRLLKKGLTEGNDPIFRAFVRQGNLLLFVANGIESPSELNAAQPTLWQTDGMPEGTMIVRSLSGRPYWPENFERRADGIYFYDYDLKEPYGAGLSCSLWKGTGTSATTFTAQLLRTYPPAKPCAGLEPQVQALPPACIAWQPIAFGSESAFTIAPCSHNDTLYSLGTVVARVNADHSVTIEQHSKDKVTEIRTIP